MGDEHIILIVDDEADSLELLQRILMTAGLRVLTAQNGVVALEILARHHVDVVVIDLVMPGMCGIDLLREIRARGSGSRCIMVTAYGEMTSYLEVMNMGAVEYLCKPFNPEHLLQVIRKVLPATRGREVRAE